MYINSAVNVIAPKYFTAKQISVYTNIPVKTIYDLASQGVIPSMKIKRKVLFDLKDVEAALESKKRPGVTPRAVALNIIDKTEQGYNGDSSGQASIVGSRKKGGSDV